MKTTKNKTRLYRLFAVLLLTVMTGIDKAEAQSDVQLYANAADGGKWTMGPIRSNEHYYDGAFEMYMIFTANAGISGSFRIDTLLCRLLGLNNISMLGTVLTNTHGHELVGWKSSSGTLHSLDEVFHGGASLTAVWQPKAPPPPPELVWEVATNTTSYYANKSNYGISTVPYGSSLYLRAYLTLPAGTTSYYDSWEISYHTSDNDYHFNIPRTNANSSVQFNNFQPYNKPGTTNYIIDCITLYDGNTVVDRLCQVSYEYTLKVEAKPLTDPTLAWSAAIGSGGSFVKYDKNTNIVIGPNETIRLRICPEGGDYQYDNWDFDYSITPSDYYSAVNAISKTNCYNFNNGASFADFEKLKVEVTKMRLYSKGQMIRTIPFMQPYVFSITREAYQDPEICISVGSTKDCIDPDNPEIVVNPGDTLSMNVCLTGGNFKYDSWSFNYKIQPSNSTHATGQIAATDCYTLEPGSYNDISSLEIELTEVIFYEKDDEIRVIKPSEPYIVPVTKVDLIEIEISSSVPTCVSQEHIAIPFDLRYTDHKLQYGVRFSEDTKKAGFKDVTSFRELPDEPYLFIDLPEDVSAGSYAGTIRLQCAEIEGLSEDYPFTFELIDNNFVITQQPVAEQNICDAHAIALVAEISGSAESFQWYYNEKPIEGANNTTYIATKAGRYFLEITGECDPVRTRDAIVNSPESTIKVKWGDLLYVENNANNYQHFQWYHNNEPIHDATYVYYTNEEGLLGEYSVRCYKPDGSFEESCPMIFSTLAKGAKATVYPTVLNANDPLHVDIQGSESETGTTVEFFALTGMRIHAAKINVPNATINIQMLTKGCYVVKITLPSGKIVNEKIVVL